MSTEDDLAILKILATVVNAHQALIHLNAFRLCHRDEGSFGAMAKFRNLRTAHFMDIDATLFRRLATLPRLRALRGRFAISNPVQVIHIRGGFPALQELSTRYMDDKESRCFLAALSLITSKSLARLSLRITVPLPEDMVEYLNELCSSPTTAQLRELDLRADIAFSQFDDQDVGFICVTFASHVLAPLKRLPALTGISAVVGFQTATVTSFVVRDEDMDAIASAWPGLTRAKFGYAIEFNDFSDWDTGDPWGVCRPSLGAVVTLMERCRKLESVDIEFADVDARMLAQLEARADACMRGASPQTALRRIVFDPRSDFRHSLRVEDPPRVAVALRMRKLFPNLRSGLEVLQGESGEGSVAYRDWNSASSINLDAFRLLKALDDSQLEVES